MKIKELNLIIGVITLILFLSAHFLIGLYFNSRDGLVYFWIYSDIFLYSAIGLQLYIIVIISRGK